MKFSAALIALAASAAAVYAQDSSASSSSAPASSSSSAASSSASSSASPSSSSSAGASMTTPAPAGGADVCTALVGDPKAGCTFSSTTVPTYDSASLQDWQIKNYKPPKEGLFYSDVAEEMANTVTDFYPSLAASYSQLVEQYATALSASAANFRPDAAMGSFQAPSGLAMFAAGAVALVAGGAFVL